MNVISNIFRKSIISNFNNNNYNYNYNKKLGNIRFKNSKNKKRSKRGQKRFRDKLIERYYKCPIDNLDYTLCEACHIVPYS